MFGFFLILIITLIPLLWGLCLYRFVSAKKKNKKAPGTFSDDDIKSRKISMIILSVILGFFVLIVIGLIILLNLAVAYM
ncbi:MAG: hypothetical protein IJC84_00015 [Clostridia bacterium]|nr:hypothetical protein [Clostridia bacterium]